MSRTPRSHQPNMGPPTDIVMGPPPLPPQVGVFHAGPATSSKPNKDTQDVSDKYRRLKKRYFELEEVRSTRLSPPVIAPSDDLYVSATTQRHKDAVLELRRSGERTVSWMDEKSCVASFSFPDFPLILCGPLQCPPRTHRRAHL